MAGLIFASASTACVLTAYHYTTLPEELLQPAILSLHANFNDFVEIPPILQQLKQLALVDLTGNHLKALDGDALGTIQTYVLWILICVAELPELHKLVVAKNKIQTISGSVGLLSSLQALDLSGNTLLELPEELGRLTMLRSLNINCNKLSTLPQSLANLVQLEVAEMNHNVFTVWISIFSVLFLITQELPACVHMWTSLRRLDVRSNRLKSMAGVGKCSAVQELLIAFNELESLPDEVCIFV